MYCLAQPSFIWYRSLHETTLGQDGEVHLWFSSVTQMKTPCETFCKADLGGVVGSFACAIFRALWQHVFSLPALTETFSMETCGWIHTHCHLAFTAGNPRHVGTSMYGSIHRYRSTRARHNAGCAVTRRSKEPRDNEAKCRKPPSCAMHCGLRYGTKLK